MDPKEVQKAAEDQFRTMLVPVAKALGMDEKSEASNVLAELAKRAGVTAAAPAANEGDTTLAKSIDALTKSVTDMHTAVVKDRERVDQIEKGLDGLGVAVAKTLAFITGVKVENDADLEQVVKAIEGKPATPKAVARPVTKAQDTTVDTPPPSEPQGHPLVAGARLIAAF